MNVKDLQTAVARAHDVVGSKADVMACREGEHSGIQISGCSADDARGFAYNVAQAIFGCNWTDPRVARAIVTRPGIACVWLD